MKYLTFIRHSESYRESPPPPALMEAMGKFVEKSLKKGTLVDTGGLLPSKDGVRVRLANGKITVTDGPFSETKEVIGGDRKSTRLNSSHGYISYAVFCLKKKKKKNTNNK